MPGGGSLNWDYVEGLLDLHTIPRKRLCFLLRWDESTLSKKINNPDLFQPKDIFWLGFAVSMAIAEEKTKKAL